MTAVQIGRGKTIHAQLAGVDSPAAACGTVSTRGGSSAERRVVAEVTCKKCLAEAAPEVGITHRNEDGIEWETFTFADGSFTERRRKQVSGAWRTDFWGTTAAGKRVSILSRDAKAAREAGTFTS